MKILVTGGAGFIGSHLIRRLLKLKYPVVCIDNFDDYYSPKIKEENIQEFITNKRFKLYRADICDFKKLTQIFKKEKPDKICHSAAQVGIRASLSEPNLYLQTNVGGTLNLLKLSVKNKVQNFLLASSSSVYGNRKKIPFSEKACVDQPLSPYAATKRAAELLTYTYHHLYNLNCTILRFFTVYGPSGRPDMATFLFTDAIYKGKAIKKFGSGKSKRDYLYIDDLIDGIIAALNKNFPFQIINLGSGRSVELNSLITLIEKILQKKAKIQSFQKQAGDIEVTWADITKAKRLLRYHPKISINKGMKRFIKWYLERRVGD